MKFSQACLIGNLLFLVFNLGMLFRHAHFDRIKQRDDSPSGTMDSNTSGSVPIQEEALPDPKHLGLPGDDLSRPIESLGEPPEWVRIIREIKGEWISEKEHVELAIEGRIASFRATGDRSELSGKRYILGPSMDFLEGSNHYMVKKYDDLNDVLILVWEDIKTSEDGKCKLHRRP